jgi:hypothetical protein
MEKEEWNLEKRCREGKKNEREEDKGTDMKRRLKEEEMKAKGKSIRKRFGKDTP